MAACSAGVCDDLTSGALLCHNSLSRQSCYMFLLLSLPSPLTSQFQEWYSSLSTFGYLSPESEDSLASDPDRRLMSLIVEKVVLPKITAVVNCSYDPMSTTQTLRNVWLQGDQGGLTLGLVNFDFICSSACPILLGQVKIGQRWHGKWTNWQNS